MGFRIALLFKTNIYTHTHTHIHRQAHSTLHLKPLKYYVFGCCFDIKLGFSSCMSLSITVLLAVFVAGISKIY